MRQELNNPMIHKAIHILENFSADKETRIHAEAREKALKDEITLLREAERRGIRKEKLEIARSLLLMGDLSVHKIAQATGLRIDEIEKLKAKKSSVTKN